MKRALPGLAALLVVAGLGVAGPLQPRPARPLLLLPGTSYLETTVFKGGEPATAIGIGEGTTYVGLYVYDDQGNCVKWDDLASAATKDDVAVEWLPRGNASYTIELRNFGLAPNTLEFVLR